jgi:plasmid stabilization system protein ParE
VDFQIRITQAALADFAEILEYSWENFPGNAERFGNAVLDHVGLLKKFPYIGNVVIDRPGIRQLVHTPIVIYYRIHEKPNFVEILHFWHASRGIPRL